MEMKKIKEKKKVSVRAQLFSDTIPMIFILGAFFLNTVNVFGENSKIIGAIYWIGYLAWGLTLFRKKDTIDELAEKVLAKSDKICMDVIKVTLFLLVVFICVPYELRYVPLNRNIVLMVVCLMLAGITVLRAVLFTYYERKGI